MAERQRIVQLVLSVAVCGFLGSCATTPRRNVATSRSLEPASGGLLRALRFAQNQGWQAVREAKGVLQGEPDVQFPGVGALADRIRLLSAHTPGGSDVPEFSTDQMIRHNPDFWRAFYETAPGQPLMGLLHVGLLLAGGDAANAHNVATLWMNFGRMSLAHREEFIALDVYARGVMQIARQNRANEGRRKQRPSFAEQAQAAALELKAWPRNPDALMRLVEAKWAENGRPKRIPPGSETAQIAAKLREVDPMSSAFAQVPPICTPDLRRVRKLWLQVSDGANAGDLELLRQFCTDAQAAGLDDLALCARSLLAGWEPAPKLPDETLVRASLRRLVGESATESICSEVYRRDRRWVGLAAADRAPLAGHPGPFVHPQLEQQMLVRMAEYNFSIDHDRLRGAVLAERYVGRGQAWVGLGRLREGIADFKHALRLNRNSARASWNLAAALGKSGDFSTANVLFAQALKQTPANVGIAVGWANDLFLERRWKDAAAAYGRAARMDPSYAFPILMVALAHRRDGLPAGIASDDLTKTRDHWTAALAAYVAGAIDRNALLGRMEPHGNWRRSTEECKLDFVEGELALGRGDRAAARRHFDDCLGTGLTNYIEYYMARFELQRLGATSSRTRKNHAAGPGAEPA